MVRQTALGSSIKATGIGMHTGEKVHLALSRASVDTGVVFRRVDLDPVLEIPARIENVGDTTLLTSLVVHNERISTEEHLMSTMAGKESSPISYEINSGVSWHTPVRIRGRLRWW